MDRRAFLNFTGAVVAGPAMASSTRTHPQIPGRFALTMRSCRKPVPKGLAYEPVYQKVEWQTSETAIIICDMWAEHPCKMAQQRAADMAPRMNATISAARDHGAFIVHAPSGGVDLYKDTPFRKRMMEAPQVDAPVPIKGHWDCDLSREANLPVETALRVEGGVRGCDDPVPVADPKHDRHQHPAIGIVGWDGISHSGQEMWNVFQREGIRNVVLMGVHTNMCVLGRPFGIRMWTYLGMNVALCRDLTDALYDPRDPPHVSHIRGTELVIEHIEKYWAPSFPAEDLLRVVAGSNDPGAK